jgi:hypothetical protein
MAQRRARKRRQHQAVTEAAAGATAAASRDNEVNDSEGETMLASVNLVNILLLELLLELGGNGA